MESLVPEIEYSYENLVLILYVWEKYTINVHLLALNAWI